MHSAHIYTAHIFLILNFYNTKVDIVVAVKSDSPASPRVRARHRHGRRQVSVRSGGQLHGALGGER